MKLGLLGLGMAGAFAAPASARADEVFFSGNTSTSTFSNGTNTLMQLVYTPSTFSGSTLAGNLSIGAAAGVNVNNLGTFALALCPTGGTPSCVYDGNTFTLRVTFTAPAGITGGQTQTFVANLTGTVDGSATNGGVNLVFNPATATQTFAFNNGNGTTGTFTFHVNDLSINPGDAVSLTGRITSATQTTVTPEPASMALMGTGLLGLGGLGVVRRRKK